MLTTHMTDHLNEVARSTHPDSNRFKRAMIILLMDIQRGVCAICGEAIQTLKGWHDFDGMMVNYPMGNLDHVFPKSRGGFIGLGNLVLTHVRCNRRKADMPATACTLLWLWYVNLKMGLAV